MDNLYSNSDADEKLKKISLSPSPDGASSPTPEEDKPPANYSNTPEDRLVIQEVENHKANRELRNNYADKAYNLAIGCISFWMIAISVNACIYLYMDKQMLSENVIIAITTGVTVNVLAAFLGVIRGLFPPKE